MSAEPSPPAWPAGSPAALRAALEIVLSDAAFVACMAIADPGPLPPPTLEVEVELRREPRGPGAGEDAGAGAGEAGLLLWLSAPADAALLVAQDMLGQLEPPAPAEVWACWLELVNIVAGRLAPAVCPPGALVRLGAPRRRPGPPPPAGQAIAVQTDSGAVLRAGLIGALGALAGPGGAP